MEKNVLQDQVGFRLGWCKAQAQKGVQVHTRGLLYYFTSSLYAHSVGVSLNFDSTSVGSGIWGFDGITSIVHFKYIVVWKGVVTVWFCRLMHDHSSNTFSDAYLLYQ